MAKKIKLTSNLDAKLSHEVIVSNKNCGRLMQLIKDKNIPSSIEELSNEKAESINWNAREFHAKFIYKVYPCTFMEFLDILNEY